MTQRYARICAALGIGLPMIVAVVVDAQSGAETFMATMTVTTAGKMSVTAPVTITIDRKMPKAEADKLVTAFRSDGVTGIRRALAGVPPTGSIKLGNSEPVMARFTVERTSDKGRLLTIVCDRPILYLGAGLPDAMPKEGYDLALLDFEVDKAGNGAGVFAPAAKLSVTKDGRLMVQDYGGEPIRLTRCEESEVAEPSSCCHALGYLPDHTQPV